MTSGIGRTWRSTAIPRSSRRCATCRCGRCCGLGPTAPSSVPFRPRSSPGPAMTAMPSGTPRCTSLLVLTYTHPEAAGDASRWRHSTIPEATDRARQLGLEGAAFPWRTIRGQECSGYWPASTAAIHIPARTSPTCRGALHGSHGRRRLRRRRRPGAADARPPGCGRPQPPRPRAWLSHRRGHGSGRVQRHCRQQRLYELDGAAEPARRRRAGGSVPTDAAQPWGGRGRSATSGGKRPPR